MPLQKSPPNFATVLLAGGASSRMGQPKALLPFEGLPLWRFQANKLLSLDPRELLISAPPTLELEAGPWRVIHDLEPNLGPLAGLDSALKSVSVDFILVVAIDMPAIPMEFLRELTSSSCPKGTVPQLDGFFLGLCAFYPVQIGPLVKQVLSSEDHSVQHLVKSALAANLVTIRLIKEEERGFFRNLNRPSDLA